MKNFIQWAEDTKLDLDFLLDSGESKGTIEERAKRTGLDPLYPKGYIASQYPDNYWPPIKPTAPLDLQGIKKANKK